jgi:hypothetical protein
MIRGIVPGAVDWRYIGATLAEVDGDNQIEFFKAFVKECKSWGTNLQVEMQLSYINRALTTEERKVLSMISFEE